MKQSATSGAGGLDDVTSLEEYRPLLKEIVSGLGLTVKEMNEILEEVFLKAKMKPGPFYNSASKKIWLCRMVVRKCIYKISDPLFNGQSRVTLNALALTHYPMDQRIFLLKQGSMPLSSWVSYLLYYKLGFAEAEIAAILNTNLFIARERLHKAMRFLSRE